MASESRFPFVNFIYWKISLTLAGDIIFLWKYLNRYATHTHNVEAVPALLSFKRFMYDAKGDANSSELVCNVSNDVSIFFYLEYVFYFPRLYCFKCPLCPVIVIDANMEYIILFFNKTLFNY